MELKSRSPGQPQRRPARTPTRLGRRNLGTRDLPLLRALSVHFHEISRRELLKLKRKKGTYRISSRGSGGSRCSAAAACRARAAPAACRTLSLESILLFTVFTQATLKSLCHLCQSIFLSMLITSLDQQKLRLSKLSTNWAPRPASLLRALFCPRTPRQPERRAFGSAPLALACRSTPACTFLFSVLCPEPDLRVATTLRPRGMLLCHASRSSAKRLECSLVRC